MNNAVDAFVPKFDLSFLFSYLIDPIVTIILYILLALSLFLLFFAIYTIIRLRINPFRISKSNIRRLQRMKIRIKALDFIRWIVIDSIYRKKFINKFTQYGFTIFCGRQGSGKSVSMVEYALMVRQRFPDCIIVANFECKFADYYMSDWHDLLNIRNGTKGVLFLIDEIHSEYDSSKWKDFPENLLSQISQQRKQRIKICATSQVYSRIVKQIREQSFSVVQCKTLLGRWTFIREYDARDYEIYCDNPSQKKLRPIRKHSFIQSNWLRRQYDTYQIIERMKKISENESDGFIPRNERAL